MPVLEELIKCLENIAPPRLAENWDNVGLMLGSKKQRIQKVLCALDVNCDVVEEAIKNKVDCIVTHHPFLFSPLKKIDLDEEKGVLIGELIKNNISVYSMHTNYDSADKGINDILCDKLNLQNRHILKVTHREPFYKVVVYVPEESYEAVRKVIIDEDQCAIGYYKGCTFTTEGEGTFIPLGGSKPYIGTQGLLETVKERKIEFMTAQSHLQGILEAIKKIHPYEEVAYDVFQLFGREKLYGLGRYGHLKESISFEDFIRELKGIFKIDYVRVTQTISSPIKKIALCSGSGASFIKEASKVADIYITSDLKFHDAQEARALGLCVIDIGHYASENMAMGVLALQVKEGLEDIEVVVSGVNAETLHTL